MNVLEKLTQLANKLDRKGLYDEAAIIDEIIKEAQGGYREQVAPELMSQPDPTRMPAGAGAGGLPAVSGPGIIQPGQRGTAGKGRPKPNPKILNFQKQYNALRRQLFENRIMDKQTVKQKYPWLNPDGLFGPRTRAARPLFPEMQKMLQSGRPQQPAAQQQQPVDPTKPVQRQREQSGQSFDAAQAQSGPIYQELLISRKLPNGVGRADITKFIEQYMNNGMSPEDAAQKVRQEYGV